MIGFENCNLFCHLPAEALNQLSEQVKVLHYIAGQKVFQKGDAGDGIYLVQAGEIEISDCASLSERKVLCRVMPGEIFGEMAVLDGQPRSACAIAACECTICFVPSEVILCFMEQYPELALMFLREISGRLREFNRQQLLNAA